MMKKNQEMLLEAGFELQPNGSYHDSYGEVKIFSIFDSLEGIYFWRVIIEEEGPPLVFVFSDEDKAARFAAFASEGLF